MIIAMVFWCNASDGTSSQHHCLFSGKICPSPEFSCWQAEGLFQLDKKKCPTCTLTISCDKTFGWCFSISAGGVMHAQVGIIQPCDVNYGRFMFFKESTLCSMWSRCRYKVQCQNLNLSWSLTALSSCARCSWENSRPWLDFRWASQCSTAPLFIGK